MMTKTDVIDGSFLREIPDIVRPVIPQRHRSWYPKEQVDIKYVSQSLVTRLYHSLIVQELH